MNPTSVEFRKKADRVDMVTMRYESYDQVKGLSLMALQETFSSGDAQERVWAAWQLGLQKGGASLPMISSQIEVDLDPGTRRHLIVILAGMGEFAIIKTLALSDPDDLVQSTAARYLSITAKERDRDRRNFLVDLLRRPSPAPVHKEVMANWPRDYGRIPAELLIDKIDHNDASVRLAAIELLTQDYEPREFQTERLVDRLSNHNISKTDISS